MLGKDRVLFSKKILNFFSRLSACSSYNSEYGRKIIQFLYNSNHQ